MLLDWYYNHILKKNGLKKLKDGIINCPCCGYKSLLSRNNHEICSVCFWEDDFLDETGISGANGISLSQAKENFRNFGSCTRDMLKNVLPKKIVEKYGRK